jgi:hypothetical protein
MICFQYKSVLDNMNSPDVIFCAAMPPAAIRWRQNAAPGPKSRALGSTRARTYNTVNTDQNLATGRPQCMK